MKFLIEPAVYIVAVVLDPNKRVYDLLEGDSSTLIIDLEQSESAAGFRIQSLMTHCVIENVRKLTTKLENLSFRRVSIRIKEVNSIPSPENTLPVAPRLIAPVCVDNERESVRETLRQLVTRESPEKEPLCERVAREKASDLYSVHYLILERSDKKTYMGNEFAELRRIDLQKRRFKTSRLI